MEKMCYKWWKKCAISDGNRCAISDGNRFAISDGKNVL